MKSIYMDLLKTNGMIVEAKSNRFQERPYELESAFEKGKPATMPDEDFIFSTAPPAIGDNKSTAKIYTSFSGCDIVTVVNGKAVGEIQAVTYASINPVMAKIMFDDSDYPDAKMLKEFPVAVRIESAIFDEMMEIENSSDLILCFANEYGKRKYMVIRDIQPLMKTSGFAIDDVYPTMSIICAAKEIEPMKDLQYVKTPAVPFREICAGALFNDSDCRSIRKKIHDFKGSANNFVNKCILESILGPWCEKEEFEAILIDASRSTIDEVIVKCGGSHYYI